MENLAQKALQKIRELLASPQQASPEEAAQLQKLLQMLVETKDAEAGCEEVYELIDQYADLKMAGEDAGSLMPLVELHLDFCGDCCEEYELLLTMLKAQPD